jgi:hypothetical protein
MTMCDYAGVGGPASARQVAMEHDNTRNRPLGLQGSLNAAAKSCRFGGVFFQGKAKAGKSWPQGTIPWW